LVFTPIFGCILRKKNFGVKSKNVGVKNIPQSRFVSLLFYIIIFPRDMVLTN